MTRILVRGGTVVTAERSRVADVLLDGETVAAVEPRIAAGADRVIEATGKLVLPGGVDPHVHLSLPVGDLVSADDFASGSRAAAFGGTTTLIDFAQAEAGQTLAEAVELRLGEAAASSLDFGLHVVLREVTDRTFDELDELFARGIVSTKVFMAYPERYLLDDGAILRVMRWAAGRGALVMLHAENGWVIEVLKAELLAARRTEPRWHPASRPPAVEAEAVHRAFVLGDLSGAPVYVVHLSSEAALEEVRAARARGALAFAETCPQYLELSEADLDRPDFEGAKWVCSPPLRTTADQEALWEGLADGGLQVLATDHAPFSWADRQRGRGDFTRIPNGLPTIEHRLSIGYQGVVRGRFSVERFVDIVATTPARMFGLAPRKGTLAPGSDADVVVFDPDVRWRISAASHHMAVDYSAFQGLALRGRPEVVIRRGDVVVDADGWHPPRTPGRFLPRTPFKPPG